MDWYFYLYFSVQIYLHMKLKYETTLIGDFGQNLNPKIVAIDESLFIHDSNNEQVSVIGGIEIKDKIFY